MIQLKITLEKRTPSYLSFEQGTLVEKIIFVGPGYSLLGGSTLSYTSGDIYLMEEKEVGWERENLVDLVPCHWLELRQQLPTPFPVFS